MHSLAAAREKRGWREMVSACLLYWHLCSLDAPSVAVVWAIALARTAGIRLQAPELLVLALGTWIVYVVDRVLDGEGASLGQLGGAAQSDPLQERHYFHRRHRRLLLCLCSLSAVWLALLCRRLPGRLVEFYLLLGLPVAVYGAWVHRGLLRGVALDKTPWFEKHAFTGNRSRRPGNYPGNYKEAAVAVLFAAAVAAPALVGAEPAARPSLLLAALLFALLCWLNCALITHAEAPVARPVERQRLTGAAAALAFASAAMWVQEQGGSLFWTRHAGAGSSAIPAAALLSCLVLLGLLLGLPEGQAGARRMRVLADVGLLTPIIFLLLHG